MFISPKVIPSKTPLSIFFLHTLSLSIRNVSSVKRTFNNEMMPSIVMSLFDFTGISGAAATNGV